MNVFFLKNISKYTSVGFKEDICVVSMSAVVENTPSLGTEVAVIYSPHHPTKKNNDTVDKMCFFYNY